MAHHGRFRQITTPQRDIHREIHFRRLTQSKPSRGRRRWNKWVMSMPVEAAREFWSGTNTLDEVAKSDWRRFKRLRHWNRFLTRAVDRLIAHVGTQIPSDRTIFDAMVKDGAPDNPYLWHRPFVFKNGQPLFEHYQVICPCQLQPIRIFNPDEPPPMTSITFSHTLLERKDWVSATRQKFAAWSARCTQCGQWLYAEKSMGYVRPLPAMY